MSINEWATKISSDICNRGYNWCNGGDYRFWSRTIRLRKQMRGLIVQQLRMSVANSVTDLIITSTTKLVEVFLDDRSLLKFQKLLRAIIDEVLSEIRATRHQKIEEIAYFRYERRMKRGMESDPVADWLSAEAEVDIKLGHELYPRRPRYLHHILRAEIKYRPGAIGYLNAQESFLGKQ